MINVPVEIQNVIKNDATLKNFRVHFPNGERADLTNENIVFESVRFTESACSSTVFKFGLAEASVIEFEMVGIENIAGKTIECSMEFKVPQSLVSTYGEWYSIPYGTFVVDKCPRNHQNMAHRRVIAYSPLKEKIDDSDFFQSLTLPVASIRIPLNSLIAYYTGDVSMFNVSPSSGENTGQNGWINDQFRYTLYNQAGNRVSFALSSSSAFKNTFVTISGQNYAHELGYGLRVDKTGTITNEEFGKEFVRQFDEKYGYDVRYDPKGKKIFETNEDAIRYAYPELFQPWMHEHLYPDGSNFSYIYKGRAAEVRAFNPVFFDSNLKSSEYYGGYIVWLEGLSGGSGVEFITKVNDSAVYVSGGNINVSGFEANGGVKFYRSKASDKNIGRVVINNTLTTTNTLICQGKPSNSNKNYYGNMYNYSNAFSSRDVLNGAAELKGRFIRSGRDGEITAKLLDNSNPYQILLSDVEGNVWWDEYNVSPIGTIKYTFTNPATGQVESGVYEFNPDAKSVYDMSGNKVFESIDFSIYKVSDGNKMLNTNVFYLYTGTTDDFYTKGDFYYNTGGSGVGWVSGGVYENVTSLIKFALDNYLVPYINTVNFTPVEMNLRGLPFLEAGDAITLTAEDGTVLNSYVLDHTFSGIQHITESIDSVSGEVIK